MLAGCTRNSCRAAPHSNGAASWSATTLKVPATNDAIAAMASAAPARPFRASR